MQKQNQCLPRFALIGHDSARQYLDLLPCPRPSIFTSLSVPLALSPPRQHGLYTPRWLAWAYTELCWWLICRIYRRRNVC